MDRAYALSLDAADPLARFRDAFEMPAAVIYLDGNSLGPLPKATPKRLAAVAEGEWGQGLITSWNAAGWINAPERAGAKLARLIGARPDEVVVADSTSVNLFKLAAGALSLRPGRKTLITESGNFPTDVYVLEGVCALAGATLKVLPSDEVVSAIDEDTAAVEASASLRQPIILVVPSAGLAARISALIGLSKHASGGVSLLRGNQQG